jgi:phosphomevalonate kinase
MSKIVVLISGRRGSGKDYFAEHLQRLLAPGCERRAFADAVKVAAAKEFGWDYQQLMTDRDYKEKHRAQLIEFAETKKMWLGNGYWAQQLLVAPIAADYLVVSDWRFEAEYEAMRSTPGVRVVTVRIEVGLKTWMARGFHYNAAVDEHPSETELDDFEVDVRCSSDAADALMLKKILTTLKSVIDRNARNLEPIAAQRGVALECGQALHHAEPVGGAYGDNAGH